MSESKIKQIAYFFRAVVGFTVGLYLFSWGPVIFDGLVFSQNAELPIRLFWLSLTPLEWTTAIASMGFIMGAFLEVPTGIFADTLGRKFATVSAMFFRGLFFVAFIAVTYFGKIGQPALLILVAIFGHFLFWVSYSFISGSFVAWIQDALDEIDKGDAFVGILSNIQVMHFGMFALGSILGLYLWLSNQLITAYAIGAILCFAAALWLQFRMKENSGYDFSIKKQQRNGIMATIRKGSSIWIGGAKILAARPKLWIVFGTVAGATTLFHIIDYVWPIFSRARFANLLGQGYSPQWIALLFVFVGTNVVGSFLAARWVSRKQSLVGTLSAKDLVSLNLTMNLLAILPVLAILLFIPRTGTTMGHFWLFVAVMGMNRLAQGGSKGPADSLENYFIPKNTQERSTILSLGALLKTFMESVLFFIAGGNHSNTMVYWLIPAAITLIFSIGLVRYCTTSERSEPKHRPAVT